MHLLLTWLLPGPDDLSEVVLCLDQCGMATHWKKIGVQLGLRYPDLQAIQKNETDEEDRFAGMLYLWITSGKATKQALMNAVKSIR